MCTLAARGSLASNVLVGLLRPLGGYVSPKKLKRSCVRSLQSVRQRIERYLKEPPKARTPQQFTLETALGRRFLSLLTTIYVYLMFTYHTCPICVGLHTIQVCYTKGNKRKEATVDDVSQAVMMMMRAMRELTAATCSGVE